MAAEAECIIQVRAPAKINLALHVTGQRADGYHLLDSLVCFADVCDIVSAREARTTSLTLQGEMAKGLTAGPDNLVLRAAALMGRPAALTLEKVLPLASGIGGGSSDAAATLRALSALHGLPLPGTEALLALGADLPVCLMGRPAIMQGIGEALTPVTLPKAHLVLVNPGLECPTPQVFRALDRRDNPPLPDLPHLSDAPALAAWLHETRNDLQAPALALRPEIAAPLAALEATEACLIARMSGSGATCFGLYASQAQAESAAQTLARPGWWVRAAALL